MTKKRADQTQPVDADKSAGTGRPAGAEAEPVPTESGSPLPELPPPPDRGPSGPGRVDITGHMPDNIRIDPDITEGHPGYQESGDSEIIPPDRLAQGEGAGGEGQTG